MLDTRLHADTQARKSETPETEYGRRSSKQPTGTDVDDLYRTIWIISPTNTSILPYTPVFKFEGRFWRKKNTNRSVGLLKKNKTVTFHYYYSYYHRSFDKELSSQSYNITQNEGGKFTTDRLFRGVMDTDSNNLPGVYRSYFQTSLFFFDPFILSYQSSSFCRRRRCRCCWFSTTSSTETH